MVTICKILLASSRSVISEAKRNAAEIEQRLKEEREAITITQNGEASFVVMDVETNYESKETTALLTILAMGQKAYQQGKYSSADDFFGDLDREILGSSKDGVAGK